MVATECTLFNQGQYQGQLYINTYIKVLFRLPPSPYFMETEK